MSTKLPPLNEIVFPVGTRVRVKPDFQCDEPLRQQVLIVQYHQPGDSESMSCEPFIDNCLYTEAFQFVGPFGNWELERVVGEHYITEISKSEDL